MNLKYLNERRCKTMIEKDKAAYIAKGMDEFRYLELMSRAARLMQRAIYGMFKKTLDYDPDIDSNELKKLVTNELIAIRAAKDVKMLKAYAEYDSDIGYNSHGTDELIFYKDNEITLDDVSVDDEKIVVEYIHDFAEDYKNYRCTVILKR